MTYTDDQQKIVDALWQHLNDPDGKNAIVSGQGGVGKTQMLCMFICDMLAQDKRVAVAAMTAKATGVVRKKVWEEIRRRGQDFSFPKDHLKIETVQKITKVSKVLGLTESGDTLYTNTWKSPDGFGVDFDVLCIDELSMVPHFVAQWWQMTGVRVFGFGDFCQIPEVITSETKKELAGFQSDLHLPTSAFISGYGVKVLKELAQYSLTKVLRSDNEVALICNDLRDFTAPKTQVVSTIKNWAKQTDNIKYSTTLEDLETDQDWQIIAYKNATCKAINNQLCIGEDYPTMEDKILLFDNLNPLGKYNGDIMRFGEFLTTINNYNNSPKNKGRKIYVCMKWQGNMPRGNSKNPVERNFFNTYVSFRQQIESVNVRRLQSLPEIIERAGYSDGQTKEYLAVADRHTKADGDAGNKFTKILEEFDGMERAMAQFVMDSVEPLPRLYMVTCDYGYCLTTHKAQGSEYPKVCYLLEKFDRPLLYTGVSRAKEQVKIINLTSTQ